MCVCVDVTAVEDLTSAVLGWLDLACPQAVGHVSTGMTCGKEGNRLTIVMSSRQLGRVTQCMGMAS